MLLSQKFGFDLLFLGLVAIVAPAKAQVINYSSRATFNAAVAPNVFEDFTSNAHYPITSGVLNSATSQTVTNGSPIHPGDIQLGVTYSALVGSDGKNYFNIDASIVGAGVGFSGGFLDTLDYSASSRPITVTFDNPAAGFGFDTAGLVAGTTFTADFTFTDGSIFREVVATPTNPNFGGYPPFYVGFVGFKGLKSIQSAVLTGTSTDGFGFGFDNFAFDDPLAPAVPEAPVTVSFGLLLAFGLGGVVIAARRKKSASPL